MAGHSMSALITNHKARRDFFIEETLEAGIELTGTEVKSLRQNRASIDEAFARIIGGQVFLLNAHIAPYPQGNIHNHQPRRDRRLLLHRKEIERLFWKLNAKGRALIPLKMYFKNGWAKVELAVAKGKRSVDKRQALRRKTDQREMQRELSRRRKRA
jgi:SsrA-binding protein